ncbi:MAG: ABC transporter permease [Aeromonas sp.]
MSALTWPQAWRLGRRLLVREGAGQSLRWFVLALALCVASILSVALVADRLGQALSASGRTALGADAVLRSATPLPNDTLVQMAAAGVAQQTTVSFNSMLFFADSLQLASVRAVPSDFPFYGRLQLSPAQALQAGQVWLSPRLMDLLGAPLGAQIEVGNARLTLAGRLLAEPDQGLSPFMLAPRALIHADDIAATGALLPGSRQQWRYLLRGESNALAALEARLKPQLSASQRWQTVGDSSSRAGRTRQNAERFFRLAALAGVLLGALAMAIALQHYHTRQQALVALFKTLGASGRTLWRVMLSVLAVLSLLGVALGTLLGSGLHGLALWQLADLLPADLPLPSLAPYALSLALGLGLTALLAGWPFFSLLRTPALRVLRRELEPTARLWPRGLALAAGLFLLVWGMTHSAWMGVGFVLGLLALLLQLGGCAWLTLALLRRLPLGPIQRLALAHLARERGRGAMQLAGLALALLLVGLLWALRVDLLADAALKVPAEAPNRFVLNVTDSERAAFSDDLRATGAVKALFFPLLRARLTHVAAQAVGEGSGREGVDRELNLTASWTLPADNRITQGQWLAPARAGEVSVDASLAARLGIRLGDALTFAVDGRSFSATVSSLRHIQWDNLQPNFYFIFSPDVLAPLSHSWLVSYYLPPAYKTAELALIRNYPTVSVIDVGDLLTQVAGLAAQISRGVALLLGLITASALLVILAQTQARMAARQQELLLMRTLGASSRTLAGLLRWEFIASGLIAGLCAALTVEGAALALSYGWQGSQWRWHGELWLALPLLGAGLLTWVGQGLRRQLLAGTLSERLRALSVRGD